VLRPPFRRLAALGAAALLGRTLFKAGPPPAHTGGFGEPTCRQCHFDNALNEPGGTLTLDGVPATYLPGAAYELTVTLRREGMLRAGFQLAARFADGDSTARPAGRFLPADARTAVVWDTTTHVPYIEHTEAGTAVSDAAARWAFRWTAPARPRRAVVFHLAGNAANDDDSPLGDFIYTRQEASRPR
jgi:hypothetical protein